MWRHRTATDWWSRSSLPAIKSLPSCANNAARSHPTGFLLLVASWTRGNVTGSHHSIKVLPRPRLGARPLHCRNVLQCAKPHQSNVQSNSFVPSLIATSFRRSTPNMSTRLYATRVSVSLIFSLPCGTSPRHLLPPSLPPFFPFSARRLRSMGGPRSSFFLSRPPVNCTFLHPYP